MATRLNLGTFNILAHGLETDGFLCPGGEQRCILWSKRGPRVANVLTRMIQECHCVVTQENDEFFWLLNQMRASSSELRISGHFCIETALMGGTLIPSIARLLRMQTMLLEYLRNGKTSKTYPVTATQIEALTPSKMLGLATNIYAGLNEINKREMKFPTFMQHLGEQYAHDFAALYGLKADDVYVSDDGIGFYFNDSKVSCTEFKDAKKVGDITISFEVEGVQMVRLQTAETHVEFSVVGAHLPSGEDTKKESRRLSVLHDYVFKMAGSRSEPCFILMDSNTNSKYEMMFAKDTPTLSKAIESSPYSNAVAEKHFECFKMRGTITKQPEKACQLMFDTIDKILFPTKQATVVPRQNIPQEFGFTRYDERHHDLIDSIRMNTERREAMKHACLAFKNEDDAFIMFPQQNSPFHQIYPNEHAPSDHPPIVCSFELLAQQNSSESSPKM